MLTFGEFVVKCREAGITDETELFFIDYTTTLEGQEIHIGKSKDGTTITHWPYNQDDREA